MICGCAEHRLEAYATFRLATLLADAVQKLVAADEQLISADRRRAVELRIIAFDLVVADQFVLGSRLDHESPGATTDSEHVITGQDH